MRFFLKSFLASLVILFLSGCVNIYLRCPGTPSKLTTVYQSTQAAAALSYVIMFPQVMSWRGDASELPEKRETFVMENLITIPFGVIGYCDTACEAVIDTVCLPVDWPLTSYRGRKLNEKAEGTRGDVEIEVLK